jgi:hypothetical protein
MSELGSIKVDWCSLGGLGLSQDAVGSRVVWRIRMHTMLEIVRQTMWLKLSVVPVKVVSDGKRTRNFWVNWLRLRLRIGFGRAFFCDLLNITLQSLSLHSVRQHCRFAPSCFAWLFLPRYTLASLYALVCMCMLLLPLHTSMSIKRPHPALCEANDARTWSSYVPCACVC